MRNTKLFTLLLVLGLASTLFAADILNVQVSSQRYLDKDLNTIIHIDYQIPYNGLVFLAQKGGYFAQVEVQVEVVQADSVVFSQLITDNIGISNKDDAYSSKTYLNRVSYLLDQDRYLFRIQATDLNSQKQFVWAITADKLPPETVFSDLQLCSEVRSDSSSYLEKFHRGKVLYRTQPSHIFDKNDFTNVNLYFEVYSRPEQRKESSLIVLSVEKDSVVVSDDYLDFVPLSNIDGINLKIPISDLSAGKYDGTLKLQLGELTIQRDFQFFVTEPRQEIYFLLTNPDEDLRLLRYFVGYQEPADWISYDHQTKRRYLSSMWKSWSQTGSMSTQDALDIVRERVDYSNKFFSFFEPGWTTDMGRIHIRNGKPDEIEKGTSSDEARFVRKDYQIWKYRGKFNAVYLFVDIQMNGNYRLIYVENDDKESSNPDYLRYLGDDFDTSLLSN